MAEAGVRAANRDDAATHEDAADEGVSPETAELVKHGEHLAEKPTPQQHPSENAAVADAKAHKREEGTTGKKGIAEPGDSREVVQPGARTTTPKQ